MRTNSLTLCLLALTVASASHAGIIYDNGSPRSDLSPIADAGLPQFVADDFVLQAPDTTITNIRWWGHYAWGGPGLPEDDFTISIFEQVGNAPAIAPIIEVHVGAVDRARTRQFDRAGATVYFYSTFLDVPITLAASTTYYLSITNNTYLATGTIWSWSNHRYNNGNNYFREDPNGPWIDDSSDMEMAFFMTDYPPIPEPLTLSLLGMGLAGLSMQRMKRRA